LLLYKKIYHVANLLETSSHIVAKALMEGANQKPSFTPHAGHYGKAGRFLGIGIWTPDQVMKFAQELTVVNMATHVAGGGVDVYMIRFILISMCAIGNCCADEVTSLEWKVVKNRPIALKTVLGPLPLKFNPITGFTLAKNPQLLEKTIANIKSIEIPESPPLITSLTKSKDHITVRVVNAPQKYSTPAKTDEEKTKRDIMEKTAGMTQLLGDINIHGDVESFFLQQRQKNVMSIFFKLPDSPVKIGESWSIPVNFIELSNGFVATKAERINKVTLYKISNDANKETLAGIFYNISETVEGYFESFFSKEKVPTSVTISFLGYGDFSINKGIWKKFSGMLTTDGTGMMSKQ